ncbi:hypothetical protein HYV72_01160 [Candidatus Uhrbacteria bacterium]|nr:hypothetical protein [Candidatus Uhrbacteria bacterium]
MRKHLTWFPFLLVALTVILALTIVWFDEHRAVRESFVEEIRRAEEPVAFDAQVYYATVKQQLAPVWDVAASGEGDASMAARVRDALIDVRVPGDARETHIRIIAALNALERGLNGAAESLADAQLRFRALEQDVAWIR